MSEFCCAELPLFYFFIFLYVCYWSYWVLSPYKLDVLPLMFEDWITQSLMRRRWKYVSLSQTPFNFFTTNFHRRKPGGSYNPETHSSVGGIRPSFSASRICCCSIHVPISHLSCLIERHNLGADNSLPVGIISISLLAAPARISLSDPSDFIPCSSQWHLRSVLLRHITLATWAFTLVTFTFAALIWVLTDIIMRIVGCFGVCCCLLFPNSYSQKSKSILFWTHSFLS